MARFWYRVKYKLAVGYSVGVTNKSGIQFMESVIQMNLLVGDEISLL